MNFLAVPLARMLWAGMLWFMRRRWMRRIQRNSVKLFPDGPNRDRAWKNFRSRERFARRYGLRILTFVINCCLYSIAILMIYSFLTYAIEQRWIPTKEE